MIHMDIVGLAVGISAGMAYASGSKGQAFLATAMCLLFLGGRIWEEVYK